jgi:hypothetical protein
MMKKTILFLAAFAAALSLSAPTKDAQARCVSQLESAGLTVRIGG